MNSAIVNVKVKPEVKKKAKEVAEELGFSLSSLINGYLKQLIKTKTITFTLEEEEPTAYLLGAIKRAEKEIKAGKVRAFKNPKQALEHLDKLIAQEENETKD